LVSVQKLMDEMATEKEGEMAKMREKVKRNVAIEVQI